MMIFFLLLSVLGNSPAKEAQLQRKYVYQHWRIEDQGLSSNSIWAIGQDPFGFLWIGTAQGLQRYDGERFEKLGNPQREHHDLFDRHITQIHLDRKGLLWVGTFERGLFCLDPSTLQVTRYDLGSPRNPEPQKDRINAIAEDQEGRIWIGTLSGLICLDPQTQNLSRYTLPKKEPIRSNENIFSKLFIEGDGTIWVGAQYGLYQWDDQAKVFQERAMETSVDGRKLTPKIGGILRADDDALWVGSLRNGLHHYPAGHTGKGLQYFQDQKVFCLVQDDNGLLWLGLANQGLQIFDPKTGHTERPFSSDDDPDGLGQKSVVSLFKDSNGVFWIGTQQNGLYKFHPRTTAFNHFQLPDPNQNAARKIISSVGKSHDQHFWIGTEAGQLYRVTRDYQLETWLDLSPQPERITSILEDRQGKLWVGLDESGLMQANLQTGVWTTYVHDPLDDSTLSNNDIKRIDESPDGTIWVGTYDGFNQFEPTTGTFKRFKKTPNQPNALDNHVIYALLASKKGDVWLGHNRGEIHQFLPAENKFWKIRITHQESLDDFDYRVTCFAEGLGDAIFAGTLGDGVKRIDRDSHQVIPIPGGPRFVMAMLQDQAGHLWVSGSEHGLFRFDFESGQIDQFGAEHGLQGLRFSPGSATALPNQALVFGGANGLNVFQANQIRTNPNPPRIVFQNFLAFGKPVLGQESPWGPGLRALNADQTFYLHHSQKTLTVKFQALQVIQPEKVAFQYKLEPLDQTWKPLREGQREVDFYNLGPGHYQYALRAANGDGVWTQDPNPLTFVIKTPPWKSTWAYLGYLILALLLGRFWIWNRTQKLQKQAKLLASEVETRTKEIQTQKDTIEALLARQKTLFANVSHEFRTPLTLIIGPLNRVLRTKVPSQIMDPLIHIRGNAKKLLRMVDQILDLARLGNTDFSPASPIHVSERLARLIEAFEGVFKEHQLTLTKNIAPQCWIRMNPDSFEKVFLNLLSNAVKYTQAGDQILISLSRSRSKIELVIEDTGLGIEAHDLNAIFQRFYRCESHVTHRIPGAGIGLAIVKELTEANRGQIEVRSEVGQGTCFTLHFPACEPSPQIQKDVPAKSVDHAIDLELETLGGGVPIAEEINRDDTQKQTTILLIEDNALMSAYIQSELAPTYDCHLAVNGELGLEKARTLIPDLIISDVMMPGMDGYQVTQALKTDLKTSHIPVILLTARGDHESRIQGLREGADVYLSKPFDALELKYNIQNLLSVRDILKKRYSANFLAEIDAPSLRNKNQSPLDLEFLESFQKLLSENYQNSDFSLKDMAHGLALSERPIQRKLKALTDLTPSQYLRIYRLKKAAALLNLGQKSSDVAFQVGFSSHAYFSSCFKAHFSVPPSQYSAQDNAPA